MITSSGAPADVSVCFHFASDPGLRVNVPDEAVLWMNSITGTQWIVERANSLGFERCGVARAEAFPELAQTSEWLARGYAGEMKYLADSRRSDPQSVLPGVRSVIVCLLNYNTAHPLSTESSSQDDQDTPRGWISRYAWGSDYHEVLRDRLDRLAGCLGEHFPGPIEARSYVDTGPVQERVLAKHAGLGWIGKNTLLLNETLGSFFFSRRHPHYSRSISEPRRE